MPGKTPALDEFLSKDDTSDHYEPAEGRPGRKPGSQAKPAAPRPQGRNTQAWRAIEDMKATRRLDDHLKEVYEDK
jgi:hypothetical protein